MPFPPDLSDPKKGGNQIAWNYDFNTHGDAYHWLRTGPSLTVQNHTERVSSQDMYELYYVSRVDVDPKPNLLKENTKEFAGAILFTSTSAGIYQHPHV